MQRGLPLPRSVFKSNPQLAVVLGWRLQTQPQRQLRSRCRTHSPCSPMRCAVGRCQHLRSMCQSYRMRVLTSHPCLLWRQVTRRVRHYAYRLPKLCVFSNGCGNSEGKKTTARQPNTDSDESPVVLNHGSCLSCVTTASKWLRPGFCFSHRVAGK